jgi:signal transduction histidine kinase
MGNAGRQVCLSISDNGPGMSDEVKDRLFDPFFTTKQRIGGTGLGMSITYGIIKEHGGAIEVDTLPGQGTTFHYILPVAGSAS